VPQLMRRDRTPADVQAEAFNQFAQSAAAKGWTVEKYAAAAYGWDKPGKEGLAAMVGSIKGTISAQSETIRKAEFRLSLDPEESPVTLDKLLEGLPTTLDKLNQALWVFG